MICGNVVGSVCCGWLQLEWSRGTKLSVRRWVWFSISSTHPSTRLRADPAFEPPSLTISSRSWYFFSRNAFSLAASSIACRRSSSRSSSSFCSFSFRSACDDRLDVPEAFEAGFLYGFFSVVGTGWLGVEVSDSFGGKDLVRETPLVDGLLPVGSTIRTGWATIR